MSPSPFKRKHFCSCIFSPVGDYKCLRGACRACYLFGTFLHTNTPTHTYTHTRAHGLTFTHPHTCTLLQQRTDRRTHLGTGTLTYGHILASTAAEIHAHKHIAAKILADMACTHTNAATRVSEPVPGTDTCKHIQMLATLTHVDLHTDTHFHVIDKMEKRGCAHKTCDPLCLCVFMFAFKDAHTFLDSIMTAIGPLTINNDPHAIWVLVCAQEPLHPTNASSVKPKCVQPK